MANAITDYRFFSGGRALFTVSNGKGEHYTYKIRQAKGDNKPFFVSLLTGPQNESDYSYLGLFNPSLAKVFLTAKSKMNDESTPVKVLRWAIQMVYNRKSLPEGYAIQHEGKCCHCGRTLTVPESIEKGIGPECEKYWK
jgi:hypothetical protein